MDKSMYIFSHGELRRRGNTLYFEGNSARRHIPVEVVRDLYLFGEVNFNKRLLEFLSVHEILLHVFNHYGYYVGTFYPREHYNSGHMILAQVQAYLDPSWRLRLAKAFVDGSLQNIRRVLKYYEARGRDVQANLTSIEGERGLAADSQSISELMAAEGRARDAYYRAWDAILQHPAFGFEKRSRRPPANRLNALLSFGNSYLYTAVLSEIYKTHLDPRIGYLHTTNFRRFTLNLDIAEVFKPIVVDRSIFTLIGRQQITEKDFLAASGGIRLREDAQRTFIEELERRMQTQIEARQLHRKVSYRRLIRMEIHKLEKDLLGEEKYVPFVMSW